MKARILSVLLVAMMIVALIPMASFGASAAVPTEFDVKIYVSATGSDDNDGKSESTAMATLLKAVKAVEAANPSATQKAVIYVSGAVKEHGSYPSQVFLAGGKNIETLATPIYIIGATADASVTVMTSNTDASTRRYGMHDLYFKDLTMKSEGDLSSSRPITLTPGPGSLSFDNVKFDSAIKWRIVAGSASGSPYTEQAKLVSATADNPREITSTIAFYNGDYTSLNEVSCAMPGYKTGSGDKNVTDGVPSAATNYNSSVALHYEIIIGEGAKMGTVCGSGWSDNVKSITINVLKGAEVATLQGTVDGMKLAGTAPIVLKVDEGATVGTVKKLGANSEYAGEVIDGAAGGPATADASTVVFFSILAVLSLAGATVLKKRSVR